MKDPRNFWDKLFRRKEKTVKIRDKKGRLTGETVYKFDRYGQVISKTDFSLEADTVLVKRKSKTYIRLSNGSYDPDKTIYYDSNENPITINYYSRDPDEMLCCRQKKFISKGRETLLIESTDSSYDGGAWTTKRKENYEYDDRGFVTHESFSRLFEGAPGLVCIKEKTYARNKDGFMDPKETTYFDKKGRVTKKKLYYREMTEIHDMPLLFCDESAFTYPKGDEKKVAYHKIFYTFNPRFGWSTMEELEQATAKAREEKQQKIQELEAQLAELKGEKKPKPTDTQRLVALRRGMDPH